MRDLLSLLRPGQWVKNLFLFAPILFDKSLTDPRALLRTVGGFAAFCVLASGVYVLNAIVDRESDAAHPTKRHRPLPAGRVGVPKARGILVVALVLALGGSALLGPLFLSAALGYLVINVGYCFWLKQVVILDVMAIAGGFVVRVLAGAAAAEVEPSQWLLLCTMLISLFLGFGKRRAELTEVGERSTEGRVVLEHYSTTFLDQMMAIVTSATLICYILYVTFSATARDVGGKWLILTVPFVLYGIFRYLYVVYHLGGGSSPTRTALTDLPLLCDVLLWAVLCGVILYA